MTAPAAVKEQAPVLVGDAPMDETSNIDGFLTQFDDPPSKDDPPPAQVSDDPPAPVEPKKSETKEAEQKTKPSPDSTEEKDTDVDEVEEREEEQTAEGEKTQPPKFQKRTPEAKKIAGLEKWNRQMSHQLAEQSRLIEKLTAKVDGTYQEPEPKTEKEIASEAEFNALERISRRNANREFGEEYVNEQIYARDSPYRQLVKEHRWVGVRVDASDDPTREAILALRQQEFFEEYGSDPEVIVQTITDKARAAVLQEVKQQSGKKETSVGSRPPSTAGLRTQREKVDAKKADDDFSLDDVCNPGLAAIHDEFV